MLGNNADQFMTTPMATSITTQSTNPNMQEMPAPRPISRTSFIPGLGSSPAGFMPGFGSYVDAPSYSGTAGIDFKNPKTLMIAGAIGLGAYFLLFKKGKKGAKRGRVGTK